MRLFVYEDLTVEKLNYSPCKLLGILLLQQIDQHPTMFLESLRGLNGQAVKKFQKRAKMLQVDMSEIWKVQGRVFKHKVGEGKLQLLVPLAGHYSFYDSDHFAEGVEVDKYPLLSVQSNQEPFGVFELVSALLIEEVGEVVIGFGWGIVNAEELGHM